jgi:hypothetical protein
MLFNKFIFLRQFNYLCANPTASFTPEVMINFIQGMAQIDDAEELLRSLASEKRQGITRLKEICSSNVIKVDNTSRKCVSFQRIVIPMIAILTKPEVSTSLMSMVCSPHILHLSSTYLIHKSI